MSAGYIEDRWLTKKVDASTGKRRRTARYGKGKRYRVAGIPGVKDCSFESHETAKAWLKSAGADSAAGVHYDPRDGNLSFGDYVERHWWPGLRKPPSTKEAMSYRIWGHLMPYLGDTPLRRIDGDRINLWVTQAEAGGLDVGTVHTTWQHLSSILQAAHEARRIPYNPCRGHSTVRPPKRPRTKPRALPQAVMAAVRSGLTERYRVLADLGVGAGLRQGEAFGFSPGDLDGGELTVRRQVMRVESRLCFGPPKGEKERTVPVPAALAELVRAHQETYPAVEVELPWVDPRRPNLKWEDRPRRKFALLVSTRHGNALNRTDFNADHWKAALAGAGLVERREDAPHLYEASRELGFHITRHTYASAVLQAGESIVTLAQWLGHEDPAFTLRTYTHFMPEAGSRGVAAMDRWLRGLPPAPPVEQSD